MTKNKMFLCTVVALAFVAGSLSGCASTGQNLQTGDQKYNLVRPKLNSMSNNQVASIPGEIQTSKTLPEMTSDELEQMGDVLLSRGDLQMAFVRYDKSLQLNPDNTRVLYKKAFLYVLGGMYEEAIKGFKEVLKRAPGHALSYEGLGQAFFHIGKYDEAQMNFRKGIELNGNLWKAHNFLGIICDYDGTHETAVQEYAAAIRLRPDEGVLYNNLGISYAIAGRYEEAINAFHKALETEFSKRKIYNNLGLVLARLERYQQAFEAFRQESNEAQAYNNLGCVYLNEGKYKKAISCFEKAIAVSPGFYVKANQNLKKARMATLH
jgi:tetratricopeptide (TPR) repeat protein